MNRWKLFGRFHTALYQLTGGRFGHHVPDGRAVLLLTTRGRKSGRLRTSPLVYMPLEGSWLVAASNGGAEQPPAWWLNLLANAEASIRVGPETIAVRARRASNEEEAALWPRACEYNDHWAGYRERCQREIPLVVLERP